MRWANRHSELGHVLDGAAVHAQGSLYHTSSLPERLVTPSCLPTEPCPVLCFSRVICWSFHVKMNGFPLLVEKVSLLVLYGGFEDFDYFEEKGERVFFPVFAWELEWLRAHAHEAKRTMAPHRAWVMVTLQSHSGTFNIPASLSSPEHCFVFCRACAYQSKGRCSGFKLISENFSEKYVLEL